MKGLLIIHILLMTCVLQIKAQYDNNETIRFVWGIKAELNRTGFVVRNMPIVNSTPKVGFTLGGTSYVELSDRFFLQGEFSLNYKTSSLEADTLKGTFRYWGAEIPIYGGYQWKLSHNRRFYIGVGPFAEFGFKATLSTDEKQINLYDKHHETQMSAMQDFNSGFAFLIGYQFSDRMHVVGSYKHSITNVLDRNSSLFTMLPTSISIGLGYSFP